VVTMAHLLEDRVWLFGDHPVPWFDHDPPACWRVHARRQQSIAKTAGRAIPIAALTTITDDAPRPAPLAVRRSLGFTVAFALAFALPAPTLIYATWIAPTLALVLHPLFPLHACLEQAAVDTTSTADDANPDAA